MTDYERGWREGREAAVKAIAHCYTHSLPVGQALCDVRSLPPPPPDSTVPEWLMGLVEKWTKELLECDTPPEAGSRLLHAAHSDADDRCHALIDCVSELESAIAEHWGGGNRVEAGISLPKCADDTRRSNQADSSSGVKDAATEVARVATRSSDSTARFSTPSVIGEPIGMAAKADYRRHHAPSLPDLERRVEEAAVYAKMQALGAGILVEGTLNTFIFACRALVSALKGEVAFLRSQNAELAKEIEALRVKALEGRNP